MAESPSPPPAKRADAERNRGKILAAARAAFSAPDADASMAEISRQAGVGMATLYRNFSSRRELLEALYIDEVDAVVAAADAPSGDTPGDRLVSWLHSFFAYFSGKRHVASELLEQTDENNPVFGQGLPRVLAAGRPLLLAAQDAREIRDDLTLEQVLSLVAAIAKIPGDPAYLKPMLEAALDGLRRPV
jgi:AcrR family transcriptional regulator